MIYNELNREWKEEAGRLKYLHGWLNQTPECTHFAFIADPLHCADVMFFSAGTLCIAEIKNRNYSYSTLSNWGAEVDAKKGRNVRAAAQKLNAIPLVITCTIDGRFIISDLRLGTRKDLSMEMRPEDDNGRNFVLKEMLNLKNCTISETIHRQNHT